MENFASICETATKRCFPAVAAPRCCDEIIPAQSRGVPNIRRGPFLLNDTKIDSENEWLRVRKCSVGFDIFHQLVMKMEHGMCNVCQQGRVGFRNVLKSPLGRCAQLHVTGLSETTLDKGPERYYLLVTLSKTLKNVTTNSRSSGALSNSYRPQM